MRISDWSSDVCSSDLDIVTDSRRDLTAYPALKAIVGVAQVVAARRAALAGHAIADERIAAGVGARRGAAECARLLRAQEGIVAVDRIDLALEQGRGRSL